jgi:hypothetical protein
MFSKSNTAAKPAVMSVGLALGLDDGVAALVRPAEHKRHAALDVRDVFGLALDQDAAHPLAEGGLGRGARAGKRIEARRRPWA